jgi:hypothetical protein
VYAINEMGRLMLMQDNQSKVKKSIDAIKRLNDFSYLIERQRINKVKNDKLRLEYNMKQSPIYTVFIGVVVLVSMWTGMVLIICVLS